MFAAALLAVLALLVPAAAPVPATRVAAFGDSLLAQSADDLVRFGRAAGLDVHVDAAGGTSLCDYRDEVRAAVTDRRTPAVVVAFTGNNLTDCIRDQRGVALADQYANEVAAVMEAARPSTTVVWVTAPANRLPNPDGDGVRAAVTEVAGRWRNALVADGGALLTPGGHWSATQPCLFFERCSGPVVVRTADGVHLTAAGGLRYALAIIGPLRAGLR